MIWHHSRHHHSSEEVMVFTPMRMGIMMVVDASQAATNPQCGASHRVLGRCMHLNAHTYIHSHTHTSHCRINTSMHDALLEASPLPASATRPALTPPTHLLATRMAAGVPPAPPPPSTWPACGAACLPRSPMKRTMRWRMWMRWRRKRRSTHHSGAAGTAGATRTMCLHHDGSNHNMLKGQRHTQKPLKLTRQTQSSTVTRGTHAGIDITRFAAHTHMLGAGRGWRCIVLGGCRRAHMPAVSYPPETARPPSPASSHPTSPLPLLTSLPSPSSSSSDDSDALLPTSPPPRAFSASSNCASRNTHTQTWPHVSSCG